MNRWVISLTGLALLVSFALVARAGQKLPSNVGITNFGGGSYQVQGAMGTVHNSTDSVQNISCGIAATTTAIQGFCSAKDTGGVTVGCTTTNNFLIQAIAALHDSYVLFTLTGGPSAGTCTGVQALTASTNEGKGSP